MILAKIQTLLWNDKMGYINVCMKEQVVQPTQYHNRLTRANQEFTALAS